MSSFFSEIGSGNQSSILPKFDSAAQISQREALILRTQALNDAAARQRCGDRLDWTERQTRLMATRLARAETAYIDQHLRPGPVMQPGPGAQTRSYEARVQELRAAFAATPDAKARCAQAEARTRALWLALERRIDRAERAQPEPSRHLSRDEFVTMRTPSSERTAPQREDKAR